MPACTLDVEPIRTSVSTDAEAVRAHVQRVTASAQFRTAPRLASFLTFVVETALAGRAHEIKESLVAVEVYGRRPDYNPQIDSTVRVEAGRLRSRLAEYYGACGSTEELRIELPKGTYAPVFHFGAAAACAAASTAAVEPILSAPEQTPARPISNALRLFILAATALGCCLSALWWVTSSARPHGQADAGTMDLYYRAEELLRIPVLKDGAPEALPASVVESVRLLGEVTTRSPRFARGWLRLAEASEWEYELRGNKPAERLEVAKASVGRALALDPTLGEGWTLLASILLYREWSFDQAEQACRRALALNPRDTVARQRLIDALHAQRKSAEAAAEADRGIALHPAAATFQVRKASLLYEAANYEQALIVASAAARLTNQMPFYPMALNVQGLSLEQMGRFDEAEKIFRAALAYQNHNPWAEPALGHLLAKQGRHREAEAILSELRNQGARGAMTHVTMALVYTGLGKHEDALVSLERAVAEKDDAVLFAPYDPRFRPLASSAQFQRVIAQLGRLR
ncbi:MAG TPA: tetratricopeptide repeat protein [Bryobacteraceae bacterium]|nr:tetratricopeptide repeat protein [Bryobacteraceae bacterium]